MSARVDALANDLVNNAQKAAAGAQESYLVALQVCQIADALEIEPGDLLKRAGKPR